MRFHAQVSIKQVTEREETRGLSKAVVEGTIEILQFNRVENTTGSSALDVQEAKVRLLTRLIEQLNLELPESRRLSLAPPRIVLSKTKTRQEIGSEGRDVWIPTD